MQSAQFLFFFEIFAAEKSAQKSWKFADILNVWSLMKKPHSTAILNFLFLPLLFYLLKELFFSVFQQLEVSVLQWGTELSPYKNKHNKQKPNFQVWEGKIQIC